MKTVTSIKKVITPDAWQAIRRHFRRSFSTNLHVAIATVEEAGQPTVTPIGSFLLNDDGTGFFFEIFTASIGRNAQTNRRVCVMAVNSGLGFWLRSFLTGKFSHPPMIKLYGEIGERKQPTEQQIQRFQRRAGWLLKTRGGKLLWGEMNLVREIRFDGYETARIGRMTGGYSFQ